MSPPSHGGVLPHAFVPNTNNSLCLSCAYPSEHGVHAEHLRRLTISLVHDVERVVEALHDRTPEEQIRIITAARALTMPVVQLGGRAYIPVTDKAFAPALTSSPDRWPTPTNPRDPSAPVHNHEDMGYHPESCPRCAEGAANARMAVVSDPPHDIRPIPQTDDDKARGVYRFKVPEALRGKLEAGMRAIDRVGWSSDAEAAMRAEHGDGDDRKPLPGEFVDVVFDGPPSHESGRFVEVEDREGKSIAHGEWINRGDGMWALRIPLAARAAAVDFASFRTAAEELRAKLADTIADILRRIDAVLAEQPDGKYKVIPVGSPRSVANPGVLDALASARAALGKLDQLRVERGIRDTDHTWSKASMFLREAIDSLSRYERRARATNTPCPSNECQIRQACTGHASCTGQWRSQHSPPVRIAEPRLVTCPRCQRMVPPEHVGLGKSCSGFPATPCAACDPKLPCFGGWKDCERPMTIGGPMRATIGGQEVPVTEVSPGMYTAPMPQNGDIQREPRSADTVHPKGDGAGRAYSVSHVVTAVDGEGRETIDPNSRRAFLIDGVAKGRAQAGVLAALRELGVRDVPTNVDPIIEAVLVVLMPPGAQLWANEPRIAKIGNLSAEATTVIPYGEHLTFGDLEDVRAQAAGYSSDSSWRRLVAEFDRLYEQRKMRANELQPQQRIERALSVVGHARKLGSGSPVIERIERALRGWWQVADAAWLESDKPGGDLVEQQLAFEVTTTHNGCNAPQAAINGVRRTLASMLPFVKTDQVKTCRAWCGQSSAASTRRSRPRSNRSRWNCGRWDGPMASARPAANR